MEQQQMKPSDKLREFADFLDAHPDFPIPLIGWWCTHTDKETLVKIARYFGTDAKKEYDDYYCRVRVMLPSGQQSMNYVVSRESVCTPLKKESVFVEAQPEHWIEKVVEWECHPLLKPDPELKAEPAMEPIQQPADDIPF